MRQKTAPVGWHGCPLGEEGLVAADAWGALEVVHFEVRHRIEGLNLVAPPRRLLLCPTPHLLQRAVPFWGARAGGAVSPKSAQQVQSAAAQAGHSRDHGHHAQQQLPRDRTEPLFQGHTSTLDASLMARPAHLYRAAIGCTMTGAILTCSQSQPRTCRLCSCAAIATAASSPASPPQSAASQSPCTLSRQTAYQAKRQIRMKTAPRELESRQKQMMLGRCQGGAPRDSGGRPQNFKPVRSTSKEQNLCAQMRTFVVQQCPGEVRLETRANGDAHGRQPVVNGMGRPAPAGLRGPFLGSPNAGCCRRCCRSRRGPQPRRRDALLGPRPGWCH